MKYLKTILLLFLLAGSAKGQQSALEADTNVRASAFGGSPQQQLNIGDTIPEALWNLSLRVVNHPEGKETITLADYKDKLIIIDFWATWCAVCLKSLPNLDTLQMQFPESIAVIPTTFEDDTERILSIFEKRGMSLPTAISETTLKQYFPHKYLPHQVWIKDNIVRAIANHGDATAANIKRVLDKDNFNLYTKKDVVDYSRETNISIYANVVNSPVLYSAVFTGWIDGIPTSLGRGVNDESFIINYTNVPAISMYRKVLTTKNNQIILKSDNPTIFFNTNNDTSKLYSYQLIIPKESSPKTLKERIIYDLNSFFKLELDSQVMDMQCFVIKDLTNSIETDISLTEKLPKSVEVYENELSTLVDLLNFTVKWTPNQHIYINESGRKKVVNTESYKVLQKDPDRLKSALLSHGLTVIKEKRPIKMYILSDVLHALQMRASGRFK